MQIADAASASKVSTGPQDEPAGVGAVSVMAQNYRAIQEFHNGCDGLLSAAAIDAAIHDKADAGMTGGLVLVFKTEESPDAQVWYLGTAFEGTNGTDVVKLATLVGISDLSTLTTDNFAVV